LAHSLFETVRSSWPICSHRSCVDRLAAFSEQRFEFREEFFNGVQVGRIGRQIEHRGAGQGDGLLDTIHFVAAQVVEDDDIAAAKRGAQELLDPSQEQFSVHGAVDHHGRSQLMVAQAGDERRCFPIAEGRRIDASTTLGGTAMVSCHVGGGPGFIDKYKLLDVHRRLRFSPGAPRCLHVLALLLAGVQGFF